MTMPIYVFSGAPTLADMLNSVAIFIGTSGYTSLCVMIGLVGIAYLCYRFLSSGNYMQLFAWAAVFIIAESFFIINTTDVEVIDVTDKTSFEKVDNIPLGLAFIASFTSTISYGLAKDVAFAFQMPNDQDYAQTGFMFGSKLANTTLDAHMTDTAVMSQWDNYTSQCILPDIALANVNKNKYTMKQLNNAPDIFEFLANHSPSPLRGISINGNFTTCKDALPILKTAFESEADKSATLLGKTQYPDRKTLQGDIKNIIGNTYNYLFSMPNNARSILTQNMAINALKQGVAYNAAKNNAAAALNFSATQAQMGQTSAYLTAGVLAQTYIPEFQSVVFIFLIAIFPVILLFAFIPEQGIKIMQKYIMGLVFISALPVTFSILHCIMMSYLQLTTNSYSDIYSGITLSNVDQIAYKNTQLASIAGYLMSLTVYMTYIIVSGLASGLVTMAERMGALANSAINSPAHAWTTGNVSLANTNVSNSSMDNITGNKHDINPTNFSHRASYDTDAGDIIHKYSGGNSNIDQNTSNLRDTINVQSSVGASLEAAKAHNLSATKSDQESLSNAVVSRHNDQLAFADRINNDSSFSSGLSQSEQAQFSNAAHQNENITQEVMKRYNYSHDQAVKALNGLDFNANISTPLSGVFSDSLSAGFKHSNDASSDDSNSLLGGKTDTGSLQDQYNQNQQIMKQAMSDARYSEMSGDAKSLATHINEDYSNTQDATKRVSADLSEQNAINQAMRETKSDSANISRNINHEVWNDLANQYGQTRADEIVNAPSNTADSQLYKQVQQSHIDSAVASIKARYGITSSTFDSKSITQQHKNDASNLSSPVVSNDNRQAIHGAYETGKNMLSDSAHQQGVNYNKEQAQKMKGYVSESIDNTKKGIEMGHQNIVGNTNTLSGNYEKGKDENDKKVNDSILSPDGSTISENAENIYRSTIKKIID